ncbi:MAG: hypothetical protein ACOCVI_01285 [Planctomycetota bacterium]
MTTEIAIMNKSAVALAADSAVTIRVTGLHGQNHKVLFTANKLFSLSKYAPIGLMVYGNASMLGIPWETIVKMYRERLGDHHFKTLAEHSEDFFDFLDDFDVDQEVQRAYVASVAAIWCQELRRRLDNWVETELRDGDEGISLSDVKAFLGQLIENEYRKCLDAGKKSSFPSGVRSRLRKKYRKTVEDVSKEAFESLPLTRDMQSKLLTIAINAAVFGLPNQSGIVIAGFGRDELYPYCYDYDVSGVLAGKSIKKSKQSQRVSHDNAAVVMPFAQSDEVHTFMEGIGPELEQFLRDSFLSIFSEKLPRTVRDEVATKLGLSDRQKKDLHKITGDICRGACDGAFRALEQQKAIRYIAPVIQATEFLNKAELATMAETLVNLVSFRKQVTMETETVGGPIDVAIISKGDGLVWIKRKHYFPPELNHHFFANYYREAGQDAQGK